MPAPQPRPVIMPIPVIIDRTVAAMSLAAGANIAFANTTLVLTGIVACCAADIRNVVAGDPSPDGQETLLIKRGIAEVGHIFQLGTSTRSAESPFRGEDGRNQILTMGCYGTGA